MDDNYQYGYEPEETMTTGDSNKLNENRIDSAANETDDDNREDEEPTESDNDGIDHEDSETTCFDMKPKVQPGVLAAANGRKRPLARTRRDSTSSSHNTNTLTILTRKLKHYKRLNADLHHQLQKFYQNEAIAFLENKAQEKKRQVDMLMQENRSLMNQQRVLVKQLEELRAELTVLPKKNLNNLEELLICREQIRQYKEKQKNMEEQSNKNHQQAVDTMKKNKELVERIRQLETISLSTGVTSQGVTSTTQDTESIIAHQEREITRLQHRVDIMKKTIKLDRVKHEKQMETSQAELESCRMNLETFHNELVAKEIVLRNQYLQLQQLQRSLKDVVNSKQLEQMHELRFAKQQHSSNETLLPHDQSRLVNVNSSFVQSPHRNDPVLGRNALRFTPLPPAEDSNPSTSNHHQQRSARFLVSTRGPKANSLPESKKSTTVLIPNVVDGNMYEEDEFIVG